MLSQLLILPLIPITVVIGLPRWLVVKNPSASARDTGDVGLIPGSGGSLGEGNSNPLQYSCWKIPWTKELGSPQGHKELDRQD